MKIVVADKISEAGMELLRATGWRVVQAAARDIQTELADAEALIVRSATQVTAELLERAARLRVVGRAGVGVDNIDLDAATMRGVLVMNTPGSNAVSVAEHTIALLLALARQVPQLSAALQAGRWEKSSAGVEVRGKTLGLVGLGRVGVEVASRARALEMRVVAHDPYVAANVAREIGVELLGLDELLACADFVSLHTALSPATEKLINAERIARMKRGARLVNTARGELVDEAAVAGALRAGQLAGAALDVFAAEPVPADWPLRGLPNVIATPHVAGSTREAQEEVGYLIAQQVRDFLGEGILRNAVNLPNISAEQYRRVRPYLELAGRLGSLVAQITPGALAGVRITYAGEPAELGTSVLANAVLAGVLNTVLAEKVNLVNAAAVAAARGLVIEEHTRRREHGFPNTLEVAARNDAGKEIAAEGTALHGADPRILNLDGIYVETPLEGTILFTRNRDVPGVIGQIGTILGSRGVNIATFALGRREAVRGAEAIALIGVDGDLADSVVTHLRNGVAALTEARVVRLPAAGQARQSSFVFLAGT
ncbi:MAG: phosphoglycerate dehydrogenase [Candidatus Acidiferrales bacterium]